MPDEEDADPSNEHSDTETIKSNARPLKRDDATKDALQGSVVDLGNVDPWPELVNGADVLSEVAETFSRYLALPSGAADALALWCAHAHVYDAFTCSPRLNITSPEKQCGKTTLRDVLAQLVPRPLATENLTVAVLFRMVQAGKPTILADECDAWLRDNEELRGLLNSGHRRGGMVYRCQGDGHEVRAFNVFAPAVLCGIGSLPGTLRDRSIEISLKRAKPGELHARFDSRHTLREQELCQKLARFCDDNRASLEACDSTLPPGVFNRLADNWRPLFAIAECAGSDWPQRAATALTLLTRKGDSEAQGISVMLLTDIQQVFLEADEERIFSKVLIEKLLAMTDRPWVEAHHGKPINERWLARQLHSFGIASRTLRINEDRLKGYEVTQFTDAFERYLPQTAF
jgi:putative DNA primase/helicase